LALGFQHKVAGTAFSPTQVAMRKRDIELLLDFRWMVCVIPEFRRDEELLAAYRRRYDFLQSGTDLHPSCFVSDMESGQQRRGEEG